MPCARSTVATPQVHYAGWESYFDEFKPLFLVIKRNVSPHLQSLHRPQPGLQLGDTVSVRWGQQDDLYEASVVQVYRGPLLFVTYVRASEGLPSSVDPHSLACGPPRCLGVVSASVLQARPASRLPSAPPEPVLHLRLCD